MVMSIRNETTSHGPIHRKIPNHTGLGLSLERHEVRAPNLSWLVSVNIVRQS